MVISIRPQGRDEFNDLATLKIEYSKGKIATPSRTINKHDMNAKNMIGADIPLTSSSHPLVVQENIDPDILNSILTVNGYLGQMLYRIKKLALRTRTTQPLIFLYPSLTKGSTLQLDTVKKINDFSRFFCDLAQQLNLETVLLPRIGNFQTQINLAEKRNLQLIPVIDLGEETSILTEHFNECRAAEAENVPILAFKFYSFPSANIGYNLVMDNLDEIHEDRQATMFVETDRTLPSHPLNVSAPHYGPFFFADLITEKYSGRAFKKKKSEKETMKKNVRLFCKNDLVATTIEKSFLTSGKFDLDEEKELFSNDKQLQDLFVKVVEGEADKLDWKKNRPRYLARVHENLRARDELEIFQKDIDSNSAKEYLSEKPDMNSVVTDHMSFRVSN